MGPVLWLLQWPVRAVLLLLVAQLPLGVELRRFDVALLSAVVIGLLGTLLAWPLRLLFGLPWAVASLGGLLAPVSWLFDGLIAVILFGLAAWLIEGFRLRSGLRSAVLGALVYNVLCRLVLGLFGLA
ncbi:MAG: phage holin family protein [Cyanobacteria bacterium K_DeepCast_35m_m2_023]|nr:phage holin family protein [Cyanobacteria bacterium K_DeepCast_35m_m2_023]